MYGSLLKHEVSQSPTDGFRRRKAAGFRSVVADPEGEALNAWIIVTTVLVTLVVETIIVSIFLLVARARRQRPWNDAGLIISFAALGLLLLTFLGLVVMSSG
jgi:hypothetical protein